MSLGLSMLAWLIVIALHGSLETHYLGLPEIVCASQHVYLNNPL